MHHEAIRTAIREAAERKSLTAYAIAKSLDGAMTQDAIRLYFRGKSDLASRRLSLLADAVGLELKVTHKRG
jgi:uncharacterized protein involved in tellurium resistance